MITVNEGKCVRVVTAIKSPHLGGITLDRGEYDCWSPVCSSPLIPQDLTTSPDSWT